MRKKKEKEISSPRREHYEPDVVVAEEGGKQSRHIVAKLMCLLTAVVVWLYVMNLENTEFERTFTHVPVAVDGVTMLNASSDLSIISGYDNTIDVTVVGKKSEVQAMTVDDIRVSVDVSTLSQAGKYALPVRVQLPQTMQLSGGEDITAEVYVDFDITRKVPVRITNLDYIIPSSYTLGKPMLSLETVTVTGPQQVLELIDCAALNFDLGHVTSSTTIVGTPVLVDADGVKISNPYVHCDVSEITVDIPVETTKALKLTVAYASPELFGLWMAEITPPLIMVKGDPMLLATLDEIVVFTIDADAKEDEYKVSSIDLPEEVTLVQEIDDILVRLWLSVG